MYKLSVVFIITEKICILLKSMFYHKLYESPTISLDYRVWTACTIMLLDTIVTHWHLNLHVQQFMDHPRTPLVESTMSIWNNRCAKSLQKKPWHFFAMWINVRPIDPQRSGPTCISIFASFVPTATRKSTLTVIKVAVCWKPAKNYIEKFAREVIETRKLHYNLPCSAAK